ncbi:MAG: hypothetical protein ACRCW2_10535 [Cellulosilyticaceae bacterium]
MPYNKPQNNRPNPNPKPKNPQLITLGNSIEINIDPNSCAAEIRADVTVAQFTSVRLWGQIVNCNNEPVANAQIKLVKIVCKGDTKDYISIAHTTSNHQGFYQFDICSDEIAWYKVLVGKSTTGKEIIVSNHTKPTYNNDPITYDTPMPYGQNTSYAQPYDTDYNYDCDDLSDCDSEC